MSNVLMLSAIVMLVLLFFKVPVFIAVLGGSMVYFVMNPGINTVIFALKCYTNVVTVVANKI